ncbi:MAG: DUF4149 domain-containing protein [Thermodesulfobacteriota bacterium]
MHVIRFVHLISVVVWIGSIIFFSLFAAPSIFKVLPREVAGDVVGAIFPKYWMVGYVCSLVTIITLIALSVDEKTLPLLKIAILVVMTALTFYSGLAVGSKARSIKAEIRAVETAEQKEPLTKRFKTLHRRSMMLNVIILLLGLFFVYLTAYHLRI